jgi:hypothetical protein
VLKRLNWLAALLLVGGTAAAQTPQIRLDDPGSGPGPALLAQALAGPHIVIGPASGQAVLPRDSVYRQTVIVLGRETVVQGRVEAGVIVVAGDLHLHPRAVVTGRSVAIGGGVYTSALGDFGPTEAFRDFTYEISSTPSGYALRYQSLIDRPDRAITWPIFYGFRIPTYDRTNGLSIAAGPLIAVPRTELLIEPRATYRSNLGRIDPSIAFAYGVDSRTTLRASYEHNTLSNETWIWPDYMNSLSSLFNGRDTRNYYRTVRAQLSGSRRWGPDSAGFEPYIGARWERDREVGPYVGATGGPWSILSRRDTVEGMLRPNPFIFRSDIASAIGGVDMNWTDGVTTSRAKLDLEAGRSSQSIGSNLFAQATFDGSIEFPTFGLQTLRMDAHFVASVYGNVDAPGVSDLGAGPLQSTPRQRWVYVGGSGSIGTLELLERGGDQLFYFDGRYNIPIERIQLPLVGPPTLTIREILAGAAVKRFPTIAQATGLRLSATVAYVEFLIDPATRKTTFGVGLTLAR